MIRLAAQMCRPSCWLTAGTRIIHNQHQPYRYRAPILVCPATTSSSRRGFASSPTSNGKILRNEEIKFPKVRVVYKDPNTSENTHKIFDRKEALELAKKLDLDLVLVNGATDPPVCKLENFGLVLKKGREKQKEIKASQKARSLKEMTFSAVIDDHDLEVKLAKVQDFLQEGHPVKVTITAKRGAKGPKESLAVEETTLKVIEGVELYVGNVQQQGDASASPFRRDFTLNPKSKALLAAAAAAAATGSSSNSGGNSSDSSSSSGLESSKQQQ